eukprot:scaffold4527_cov48-Phaeocystis_antarctica.AAC.1
MRPARAGAARAALLRAGGSEAEAAAAREQEEVEAVAGLTLLAVLLPAAAKMQPAALLEQLQTLAATRAEGGASEAAARDAIVAALGAALRRGGGWLLRDEATGHARWVAPLLEQSLRAAAQPATAALEAPMVAATAAVRGPLAALEALGAHEAAPRLQRLLLAWLLTHGTALAPCVGGQRTLLRALRAAARLPAEELPATTARLAPLLLARCEAVRWHAALLLCRAAVAGSGSEGAAAAAAAATDATDAGGAHAAQAAEAEADAEQMSDAELEAALPPALLRVMGCADAADEAGRFMAWAAALQLFSQAP